tara:strand:+ start:25256 stop:26014 length:759 start_codon:yes stop_codon:yes gene_type:complete
MIKRLLPIDSKQFSVFEKVFKSFDKYFIDRLELLFPLWCMIAFQHYLIKSFDITIFSGINIVINKSYIFSLIAEDWIGILSIILHTFLMLELMKRFDSFGPFRTVKTDFQNNFLLFLVLYAFIDMFVFGKMMIGYFLMSIVLYLVYRSDSFKSKLFCIILTLITLIFSITMDEPVLATSTAIYFPILAISMFINTKEMTSYIQKYLILILFIFISSKELWLGIIGASYLLFFNMYYYFSSKSNYNWFKFDEA